MNTIASRFLSFEEPLGAGLVKFAYFVIAAVLLLLMVIAMIAGIVTMFEVGFLTGLGRFLLAPLQFVLALILLRVATEVVLAILSIDDQLTDGTRTEGAMPIPSPKEAMSGGGSGGLPKSPDTSVTEASKDQNQRAPFTRGADGGDVDTSETEASKDENQKAPFTRGSDDQGSGVTSDASSGASSSSAASSGGAKSVGTAPARKPAAKKATKKATKKTANASASSASSASGGEDAGTANATSSDLAKKTAEAAKAATRPSASKDDDGASS